MLDAAGFSNFTEYGGLIRGIAVPNARVVTDTRLFRTPELEDQVLFENKGTSVYILHDHDDSIRVGLVDDKVQGSAPAINVQQENK